MLIYLLWEWSQFTRFEEEGSFKSSYSSKTPTRTTHTLVYNNCNDII
jgi:hypothetical protein